jgi:hypothetical protein
MCVAKKKKAKIASLDEEIKAYILGLEMCNQIMQH